MNKLIVGILLLFASQLWAQVQQNIVVEHFTNTRCGICASRNPGFYTNLNAQDNVLHLAIHPSAPYSNCVLNQHNKTENDARTNYYGVYGATPRLVIQGNVQSSSSDYSSPSIFNAFKNQTTPLSLAVYTEPYLTDSIKIRAVVKTVSMHQLGALQLFIAIVEEELNYSAPNGEQKHHDVFRKSVFSTAGLSFNAPTTIGDSVEFIGVVAKHPGWVLPQIYALGIINQVSDKKSVQAAKSENIQSSTGVKNHQQFTTRIYPNPSNEAFKVELEDANDTQLYLYDFSGKLLKEQTFRESVFIDTKALSAGLYQLLLVKGNQLSSQKITINH